MLRRVARAILCLLGAVALLVLLLDCFADFHLETHWPADRGHLSVVSGVIVLHYEHIPPRRLMIWPPPQTGFEFHGFKTSLRLAAYHSISNSNGYKLRGIVVPLWLLAFICLAWPVTSFIVARRRRKGRGFEVQPKADNAVSTSDS